MTQPILDDMKKAMSLLRTGNVVEATSLIQARLGETSKKSEITPGDKSTLKTFPQIPQLGTKAGRPRRPLRENISLLHNGRMQRLPLTALHQEPLPPGASFEWGRFSCAAGTRAYKLYVPGAEYELPRPLIVMLHGCTQNPDDFAAGTGMNTLAEERNFLVVYPEQAQANNQLGCWNWFEPQHQTRTGGEPEILAGIVTEISRNHRVDPARIFAIGLSAGGAMAAVLGATYPECFAGIGVHSGLPYLSASDMASAFSAMKSNKGVFRPSNSSQDGVFPKTIVFHGDADATVHPSNGSSLFFESVKAKEVKLHSRDGRETGGRAYSVTSAVSKDGQTVAEHWVIQGAGHTWSGGRPTGSYTDPLGPDASRQMLNFFMGEN
jgi:poly(hydroxyalkanoate) depolymerase family esterase